MSSSSSRQAIPTASLTRDRIKLNKLLHKAIIARDYDLTKKLLEENGADAWWEEEGEDTMGWSSLHYAAESGDEKIVKLLLRRGAIWNAGESERRVKRREWLEKDSMGMRAS